jgi:hypothetical protein
MISVKKYNSNIRQSNEMRWQMTNICHMCHKAEETIIHLFIKCQFTIKIRQYIHDVTVNYYSIFTLYRKEEYHLILNKNEDMHWRGMKMVTYFVLWRKHCARIFRDEINYH